MLTAAVGSKVTWLAGVAGAIMTGVTGIAVALVARFGVTGAVTSFLGGDMLVFTSISSKELEYCWVQSKEYGEVVVVKEDVEDRGCDEIGGC